MTLVDHHAHRDLVSSWRSSSQYHMRLHECQRGDQRRKLDMPLCMVMFKPHANAAPGERCAGVGFNTAPSTMAKCLCLWSKLNSATSSKLLMHRSTPRSREDASCFLPSRCGLPPLSSALSYGSVELFLGRLGGCSPRATKKKGD